MSVSLRVAGAWAELTADGTVAIPATPQAGDRMYLYAGWKDFSVTATVANWTPALTPFADGSTSAGNGTGSVKVACWYRDWQPGDTDPTIDFSASPDNACAVIMVMQKGADDVWLTPVARTAAMTNWTTTSQSVNASATVDIPSSSVVMGLIRLRDDSAVMTRPTSGIDDSGGLVTWNGDYVESPATHHSTTTGFDGAADLGYRSVTTGAAGVTLRLTGTISAAETGAALWVVQGVSVLVTPTTASLTLSTFAPLLKLVITPAVAVLTLTAFTPTLRETVTPASSTLAITTFAAQLDQRVIPPTATLAVTSFAPRLEETVTPATALLSVATFAPIVQEQLAPATASLTLTTFAPLITQNVVITVPSASLTITTTTPHVKPFRIIFIDPGGDAVQAPDYFHTILGPGAFGGEITFDTSQKVNGIGSYKFNADGTLENHPTVSVPSVMGATRRVSAWFRYDAVPDATSIATAVDVIGADDYSGGGFDSGTQLNDALSSDDDTYATAVPAKNAGQGSVFGLWGLAGGADLIPNEAAIKTVKIRYERKYDVNTSIGISRVKYRLDGVEGPNHDNTDMPLTDTVVEVDVTADRESWARDELANGRFEVIAEARRGDSDTEHTQSWDYLEVEVEYFIPFTILGPSGEGLAFEFALIPRGDHVTLRLIDGDKIWYDGITKLFPDTDHRISWAHVLHDTNLVDIKLYVDSIQELDIVDAKCAGGASNLVNLLHGWVGVPGVNKICHFDQLYIDDGNDLTDCGNKLSTHKGPATVTDDDWNTDGGTGAVNERPLSDTNYKEHDSPFDPQRQTYTLEAVDGGDIDLSGKTLVGYMGWARAKVGGTFDATNVKLIVNGVEVNRHSLFQSSAAVRLLTLSAVSPSYPSNARGIGMLSNEETVSTTMYECGVVVVYEGPSEDAPLFPFQELAENSLTPVVDDLRADLPDSYELRYQVDETGAQVLITIYSVASEGGELQLHSTSGSSGGQGQLIINAPGIELNIFIIVVGGATSVGLRRFLNPE